MSDMASGVDMQATLRKIAETEPEALAAWMRVYVTYFRNLVSSTAEQLYRSMGLRAAMMTLGNIIEETISRSFQRSARGR